jgi:hypothetical protein
MTIMKRLIILLGVLMVAAVVVLSACRLWRILPYPVATGDSKKSSMFQVDVDRLAVGQAIASISGRHTALDPLECHRFLGR